MPAESLLDQKLAVELSLETTDFWQAPFPKLRDDIGKHRVMNKHRVRYVNGGLATIENLDVDEN